MKSKEEMPFQGDRKCCHKCISILHALSRMTPLWREGTSLALVKRLDRKDFAWGTM